MERVKTLTIIDVKTVRAIILEASAQIYRKTTTDASIVVMVVMAVTAS